MSHQEFWETMKILVDRDFRRNISDDVEKWIDNFISKWSTVSENDDKEDSVVARNRRISECSGIDTELDEEVKEFVMALETRMKKIECRYDDFSFVGQPKF